MFSLRLFCHCAKIWNVAVNNCADEMSSEQCQNWMMSLLVRVFDVVSLLSVQKPSIMGTAISELRVNSVCVDENVYFYSNLKLIDSFVLHHIHLYFQSNFCCLFVFWRRRFFFFNWIFFEKRKKRTFCEQCFKLVTKHIPVYSLS